MQCTAEAVAVHCGSGCSALRLRWVKLAPKSPVLFYKVSDLHTHDHSGAVWKAIQQVPLNMHVRIYKTEGEQCIYAITLIDALCAIKQDAYRMAEAIFHT